MFIRRFRFALALVPWLAWLAALPLQAAPRASAAAGPGVAAACSWNAPGHDPFMGDVVAAVDAYQDIPAETRQRLRQRMAARAYDEVVRIRRDGIDGRRPYRSEIRDMHFGSGRRCAVVDRSAWPATAEERGLVYCEAGHCILVPTVCRNVSRISQAASQAASRAATAAGGGDDGGAGAALAGPAVPSSAGGAPAPGTAVALAAPADSAALPLSQVAEVGSTGPGPDAGAAPGAEPRFGSGPVTWEEAAVSPPAAGFAGLTPWPGTARPAAVGPSGVPAPTAPVPEPGAPLLWLAGLVVLAACRRRWRAGR